MTTETIKNPIQLSFFEKIKQALPSNLSLANELSDLLEISLDGAYRRIRGETVLSIDEVVKICSHYKISPEILGISSGTSATFHYRPLISDESGFEDYMKGILHDLKRINSSSPKQIIYAAEDIPIFHHFHFPLLTAFKNYFWEKGVLNIPSMEGKKFNPSSVSPELISICRQMIELYVQIPSIEIWHQDTIISNLKMIEYAWDSGWFVSKEDAIAVTEQIGNVMLLLEKQAEKSSKFIKEEKWAENEGNFTMYESEVLIGNNNILVTAGVLKAVYLSHNTFNTIMTTNVFFCSETEAWLKNMIRKSTQISGMSEKQRHQFFSRSQQKVEELKLRISAS